MKVLVKPASPATLTIPLDLAIGLRAALSSQIIWLESLHPTRSRVERLNLLRPLRELLRAEMEKKP